MKTRIVQAADEEALAPLFRSGWECPRDIARGVSAIIADVRSRGDAAIVDHTRRLDDPQYDTSKIRIPIPMHEHARSLVPHEIATGLALARERIEAFHRRQLRPDIEYADSDGARYGFYARPLDSVAAYVPGGTAPLPSSVLMSIVPARLAGVSRVIVLTPPQRDGRVAPAVVFACWLCDVDELYAVGGAQAIAAAAYGTQTVTRVDKIVGPGNAWVTEAKRQVFGACALDGLAGPSEVLVVADESARPDYVAGELLAQAEHDPMARVAVVSQSSSLLEACAQAVERGATDHADRASIVAAVLEHGAYFVHARSLQQVFDVVERFAPEHLSLQVRDPQAYLPHLRRAGAVFVGEYTPVACGDYLAGSNHVLPTSGSARFSSGLRTADFQRTFSVVENTRERMAADAQTLAALAEFEGLPFHARSARLRL